MFPFSLLHLLHESFTYIVTTTRGTGLGARRRGSWGTDLHSLSALDWPSLGGLFPTMIVRDMKAGQSL